MPDSTARHDGNLTQAAQPDTVPHPPEQPGQGDSPESTEARPASAYPTKAEARIAAEDQLPARQPTDATPRPDPKAPNEANPTSEDAAKEAPAGAGDGKRPDHGPQAGQTDASTELARRPDDGLASPDTAPDAVLEDLKADYAARLEQQGAKYEAEVKDLKAMYEVGLKELAARLEQLEHDRVAEPGTDPVDRYNDSARQEEHRSETPQRWQLPSDARLALGGTVLGGVLELAGEHMATVPGEVLGYIGMAVSTAIGVVAVIRENKESRKSGNDRGPED